jgi:hypothetical protein
MDKCKAFKNIIKVNVKNTVHLFSIIEWICVAETELV